MGIVARRENGYRVYSQQNIKLLYVIKALRELDYSLGDIERILRDPLGNLGGLVDKQLLGVRREILRLRKLEGNLSYWSRRLQNSDALDIEELQILLEMQKQMLESHLSPKALEETKAKHEALGENRHQKGQKDLQDHIERCGELCSRGEKPDAVPAQDACAKIRQLMGEFLSPEARTQILSSENALRALLEQHGAKPSAELLRWLSEGLKVS